MKVEILLPIIERPHCVNLVLKNLEKAVKPEGCQMLAAVSSSDEYFSFIEKRLKEIFKSARVFKISDSWIEHHEIRPDLDSGTKWSKSNVNQEKMERVNKTYSFLQKTASRDVDYYWIMEDDNLFPFDTFTRYAYLMEGLKADIVTGVSYSWYQARMATNFWTLKKERVFGEQDACKETTLKIDYFEPMDEGVTRLGACGLVNVLMKKKVLLSWQPERIPELGSAADVSFFINAQKNNYKAYGIWNIRFPHITKIDEDTYQIMGKIDKGIMELINV